jgi:hypothetical protein
MVGEMRRNHPVGKEMWLVKHVRHATSRAWTFGCTFLNEHSLPVHTIQLTIREETHPCSVHSHIDSFQHNVKARGAESCAERRIYRDGKLANTMASTCGCTGT